MLKCGILFVFHMECWNRRAARCPAVRCFNNVTRDRHDRDDVAPSGRAHVVHGGAASPLSPSTRLTASMPKSRHCRYRAAAQISYESGTTRLIPYGAGIPAHGNRRNRGNETLKPGTAESDENGNAKSRRETGNWAWSYATLARTKPTLHDDPAAGTK